MSAAVFILVLLHWGSQFIFQGWGTLPRFLLSLISSASLLWVQMTSAALSLHEVIVVVTWFLFLTELYVFIFTLSLGSISIKVLQLLRSRSMTVTEVEDLYRPTSMVAIRFQRLKLASIIEGSEDTLKLTSRGKQLLAVFKFIHGIMHTSLSKHP